MVIFHLWFWHIFSWEVLTNNLFLYCPYSNVASWWCFVFPVLASEREGFLFLGSLAKLILKCSGSGPFWNMEFLTLSICAAEASTAVTLLKGCSSVLLTFHWPGGVIPAILSFKWSREVEPSMSQKLGQIVVIFTKLWSLMSVLPR